jgi:ABC-type Fe3+-siderophore transport system permease subunit
MKRDLTPLIILLGILAVFSFVMSGLTLIQYANTEFASQALAGSSVRIGIGILAVILILGIIKRRSWALYIGIIFMSFGIINSIWSIIISTRFELPAIFGIAILILFSATLYYIISKRHLFID